MLRAIATVDSVFVCMVVHLPIRACFFVSLFNIHVGGSKTIAVIEAKCAALHTQAVPHDRVPGSTKVPQMSRTARKWLPPANSPLNPLSFVPGHVQGLVGHGQYSVASLGQRRKCLKEVMGNWRGTQTC